MAAITLRCCALLLIASLAVLTGAWRTLGPEVRGAQGVAFRVWAPHASRVCITGSFTSQPLAMAPERNGTWYVLVGNAQIGQSYNYLIEYNGANYTRLDPMARDILMNGDTTYVSSVIHNATFAWGSDSYTTPSHFDMVIYELHVPTMDPSTPQGVSTFQQLIQKLDYLQHLGVNIVEPLPIATFPTAPRQWGYDPGAPFTVMSAFGGMTGLKQFVQACHQRGIGVFLDVVWNHLDGNNILSLYDGWSEKQAGFPSNAGAPQGIYYFQDENAVTEWGPRPNYASPAVQEYILQSIATWMKECRISGFRWDSTICIRKGGQECWTEPNDLPSGVQLLKEATTLISKLGGFSVAEDLQNNGSVSTPVNQGGMGFNAQWDDNSYYMLHDTLGSPSDSTRSIQEFAQVIADSFSGGGNGAWRVMYTENHDKASAQNQGQGRWPNIVDSANPTSYIAQKLSVLGISSVLLSPAVPLLFYGQEFLDHQNFVFGNVPNLDWSQVGNFSNGVWTSLGPFNGIFNLTRDLISLRLNKAGYSAALQTVNINVYYQSQSDLVIAFTRGQDQSVVVVMNLSAKPFLEGYYVGCPAAGTWQIRINTDLASYSSAFGNVGAGITSLPAINQPLHGFNYRINVPLGAYSTVVLSQ